MLGCLLYWWIILGKHNVMLDYTAELVHKYIYQYWHSRIIVHDDALLPLAARIFNGERHITTAPYHLASNSDLDYIWDHF